MTLFWLLILIFLSKQCYATTTTATGMNCAGSYDDQFLLVDSMPGYDIIEAVANKSDTVILHGDDNLLGNICSLMCAEKGNSTSCIGFSFNATDGFSCNLYSKVVFAETETAGPPININQLYMRYK